MVKVSVMGSTGVIGKNVTFKLARADTITMTSMMHWLLKILIVYSPHPAIMKILQIPKLY